MDRNRAFNKEISSYLHISSMFFENLSFGRRSWFALEAESPAAVHIKDVIKGLCVAVFLCACRMLHGKQGDGFLITSRGHADKQLTTALITCTPYRTIKGHSTTDFVTQFLNINSQKANTLHVCVHLGLLSNFNTLECYYVLDRIKHTQSFASAKAERNPALCNIQALSQNPSRS